MTSGTEHKKRDCKSVFLSVWLCVCVCVRKNVTVILVNFMVVFISML